jgi:hypothetical protein
MNNAEDMQERSPELPQTLRKPGMQRCYQCNGRFGLIRRRFALKQFCSKRCLDEYQSGTEHKVSRIKEWTDFLARKR